MLDQVPGVQLVHNRLPVEDHVPARQLVQAARDTASVLGEAVPAGQSWQVLDVVAAVALDHIPAMH